MLACNVSFRARSFVFVQVFLLFLPMSVTSEYRPNCHRWLCKIEGVDNGLVICRVRRSRYQLTTKSISVPAAEFFPRVHQASGVVAQFWYTEAAFDTQRSRLEPVDVQIQRECSWILGIDTSDKGAYFLRAMLGGTLGYYSMHETTADDIRRLIRSQLREMPVFQMIVNLTPSEFPAFE